MSWVGPVVKSAAKYGVKYGPHARVAWETGGKQVQAAVRIRMDEAALRRRAFDQAGSTLEGSVLRVVDHGDAVYVVFAGDEPVGSYPEVAQPLDVLVAKRDLSKRVTPEQHREQQVRERLRRAGRTAGGKVRRRRGLTS